MKEAKMNTATMTPSEIRRLIRDGRITGPTAGMCAGYAQANLVVLPKELAYDFLLFAQRNPKSCPLLEVSDTGERLLNTIAKGADIATDIPLYRIYRDGNLDRYLRILARRLRKLLDWMQFFF